ncbi:MAG: phosphotransferase family protein, partial [Candidatus Aenigmatarchaeota archaeon]
AHETYGVSLDDSKIVCSFCVRKGERCRKEEALTNHVKGCTGVPTQTIIYSDLSGDIIPYPFYIAEWVEGNSADKKWTERGQKELKQIIRQAGKYMGDLHANIHFDKAGQLQANGHIQVVDGEPWKEYLQREMRETIQELSDTRFADLQGEAKEYVENGMELLEDSIQNVLVHWDIRPENLIVKNGEIQAVLDFEKAIAGDAEYDIAYSEIHFMDSYWTPSNNTFPDSVDVDTLRKAFHKGYRKKHSMRDGWRERIAYYKILELIQGMKSFDWWTKEIELPEEKQNQQAEWMRRKFRSSKKELIVGEVE